MQQEVPSSPLTSQHESIKRLQQVCLEALSSLIKEIIISTPSSSPSKIDNSETLAFINLIREETDDGVSQNIPALPSMIRKMRVSVSSTEETQTEYKLSNEHSLALALATLSNGLSEQINSNLVDQITDVKLKSEFIKSDKSWDELSRLMEIITQILSPTEKISPDLKKVLRGIERFVIKKPISNVQFDTVELLALVSRLNRGDMVDQRATSNNKYLKLNELISIITNAHGKRLEDQRAIEKIVKIDTQEQFRNDLIKWSERLDKLDKLEGQRYIPNEKKEQVIEMGALLNKIDRGNRRRLSNQTSLSPSEIKDGRFEEVDQCFERMKKSDSFVRQTCEFNKSRRGSVSGVVLA